MNFFQVTIETIFSDDGHRQWRRPGQKHVISVKAFEDAANRPNNANQMNQQAGPSTSGPKGIRP